MREDACSAVLYSSKGCGFCEPAKQLVKAKLPGVCIKEYPGSVDKSELNKQGITGFPTLVIRGRKIVGLNNIKEFLK